MRIRWTKQAVEDFTHVCDYIDEHDGPDRARRAALDIYETSRAWSISPCVLVPAGSLALASS